MKQNSDQPWELLKKIHCQRERHRLLQTLQQQIITFIIKTQTKTELITLVIRQIFQNSNSMFAFDFTLIFKELMPKRTFYEL